MKISCTQLLTDYAQENHLDLDRFIQLFEQWKIQGEDESYFFGKDSYFVVPSNLKHVHLVPILNQNSLSQWNKNWERGSRRTSDRFLIYAEDNTRYLLIAILPEPTAHAFVKMETAQSKKLMSLFSQAADDFIYNDNIIL